MLQANNQTMYGVSLLLAPLLMFISSFFWTNGEYGVTGGAVLILSTLFWITSMTWLFGLLNKKMPTTAQWCLLFSIFGFISGGLFGFVGVMAEIFNISHQTYIEEFSKYPIATGILLFWSGPLAPVSLILLGIFFLKAKTVRSWVALMFILGGIAFPISRISRNEWIAHVADIFLLIPMWYLAKKIFSSKKNN